MNRRLTGCTAGVDDACSLLAMRCSSRRDDHADLVVSGTGRVLGLQRSSSREAMSRHADLTRRDVEGEGHTVGAEVPRMSREELCNQAATRIHWRIMPTA